MSNEVKLSKETIDTLKSLYQINQTLKIVANTTQIKTVNENKTIAVYAEIEEELPRDFCVYDLREFINVLNIIESPTLDFSNDKFVIIKSGDGSQRLKYIDGAENLINSYFERDFILPSSDVNVEVTKQQLRAVMDASSTLKLEYVGFKADGKDIVLTAFNRNNGSGDDTNGISIVVGETTDTFEMFYKAESMNVLDGDCTFEISFRKISKIENGKKTFWMALDSNSSNG